MRYLSENIQEVRTAIAEAARSCGRSPQEITLIGITKTRSAATVAEGIRQGLTVVGENRVQEAEKKMAQIREPASWHLVGHLQTNKAKKAVRLFDMIHSVDSEDLAREIDKRAAGDGKVQEVLVQVNTSAEESKSGIEPGKAVGLVQAVAGLKNIKIRGLMTIGAFLPDPEKVRPCFVLLRELRDRISALGLPRVSMEHLSMGMTGDYRVAIEEGATMVRVGRALFGERN